MKNPLALATSLPILALLLSGCTALEQPTETEPNEPSAESPASTPEPEEEEKEEDDESVDVDPRLEGRDPLEDRLNERGNLPMPENSPYFLVDRDEATVLAEAEFSELSTSVHCSSDYAPPAEGHLVSMDVTVTSETVMRDVAPDGFWLSSDLFQILDVDGEIVSSDPGGTLAAYSCPSESDQFPFGSIRPGTSGSGQIVLETPVTSGTLLFEEVLTGEYLEWEFDLSAP